MAYYLFFIQASGTHPQFHIKTKPRQPQCVIASGRSCALSRGGRGPRIFGAGALPQHLCCLTSYGPYACCHFSPASSLGFCSCQSSRLLMVFPSACVVLELTLTDCHLGLGTSIVSAYLGADGTGLSPHCHRPRQMCVGFRSAGQWTPSNRHVIFLIWRHLFFINVQIIKMITILKLLLLLLSL